jgi:hypothetical protein
MGKVGNLIASAIAPPGQEGCRAHQELSRSLHIVRGGVVDQDPPPRLRETLRLLRDIFLIAQTPLLARRGDLRSLRISHL